MKTQDNRTTRSPRLLRPRFRIEKLEERIAPSGNKVGWGHNKRDNWYR